MIPMIAWMIAVYGSCRLIQATVDLHHRNAEKGERIAAMTLSWILAIGGGLVLFMLAIVVSGASVTR